MPFETVRILRKGLSDFYSVRNINDGIQRQPISRKASRPAFLGARSPRRLVIGIYSAKQANNLHTSGDERDVGPRNTFQPSERWLETGGFRFHRRLRRTDSPVKALRRPCCHRHRRLYPGRNNIHRSEKGQQIRRSELLRIVWRDESSKITTIR